MDRNEQILSLIGLCLRGRNLEVGEEPVEAVSRARDARLILLASDAADNTARRAQRFAETGQCIWLRVPFTRRELGQAVGRGSAAIAAVTDIGLAAAVVRRLAELEPEKYDEDLARLELKAKRAAERKSEAAQHEKNLRRGIKHPKRKTPAPTEKPQKPAQTEAGAMPESPPAAVPAQSPPLKAPIKSLPAAGTAKDRAVPMGGSLPEKRGHPSAEPEREPDSRPGAAASVKATVPDPGETRIHTPTAAR